MKKIQSTFSIVSCLIVLPILGCQSHPMSRLGAENTSGPASSKHTMVAGNAARNPQMNKPLAKAPVGNRPENSVQQASANMLRGPGSPSHEVQNALYAVPSGAGAAGSTQVMPAQFGQPVAHKHNGGNCAACSGSAYKPYFSRFSENEGCGGCGSAACGGNCGQSMPAQGFAVPRSTDPQEYIFDGGDHDPQVRLKSDLTQVGLDPEDTVIQYETVDGETNVESGCRVAIYAPRFASVRKRQSTRENELSMRAQATLRPNGPGTIRDQLPPAKVSQPIKVRNSDNVRIAEGLRDRRRPAPAEMVLPMGTISDTAKPVEDMGLIPFFDLKTTDPALLARSAAAARAWSNVDELHVLVDGVEAIEASGTKNAADVTIYEHKGARIRLCKVASDQMANPGDVISFTIRFDNVGEQPLKSLVITDSLAPRLEYVESSQKSSLEANFSTTPNSAGSVVLRWELENGIKPGEGGLVRFSCKVR